MLMDWTQVINTFIGGLAGAIATILVARYSKSRAQRDVDIAKEYLSLSDMTADVLERRINLIGKLDADIRKLENENDALQKKVVDIEKKRVERDEQIAILEARVVALQAQIDADARARVELQKQFDKMEAKYRILFKYLVALLEQLRLHKIDPVPPPDGLTDPEILKLANEKDSKDEKGKA